MADGATPEQLISRWHEAVNSGDTEAARLLVSDPVVVNGPRGTAAITPAAFADWMIRSSITLDPRSTTRIGERLIVVEQDATWPQDPGPQGVATVFRVARERISAVLRFESLDDALAFATLYHELSSTEDL